MKDNGFLGFKNFWIPRENMLMRFGHLSKDGIFKIQGNPKIMYAVMLIMRVLFLNEAYYFMATSLTIGLWYALVRTQFKDISGKDVERPLIDY